MSKETPVLVAKKRDKLGSRFAQRLRAAGELPANLFVAGSAPMPSAPTPMMLSQGVMRNLRTAR